MIMVVMILLALLSLVGKKQDYYFRYFFVFGLLFGAVALILVLIK